jgi:hypothetical protein
MDASDPELWILLILTAFIMIGMLYSDKEKTEDAERRDKKD